MCALGCRVDIKNKREMTPLHTATEKNEIDAVRCLCLAGLDLNITNKEGLTAEQLAISLKHYAISNLLSSLRKVNIFIFCLMLCFAVVNLIMIQNILQFAHSVFFFYFSLNFRNHLRYF